LKVVRQAEEAAGTVAKSLLPEDCMKVLGPIIRDSEFPVSLAAIKMLTKVRTFIMKDPTTTLNYTAPNYTAPHHLH
jgi:CLIP-associating protein 1/2